LTSSIDRSLEIALKLNSKSKRDIEYFKSASLQTNARLSRRNGVDCFVLA
jgi:hypothetical protein